MSLQKHRKAYGKQIEAEAEMLSRWQAKQAALEGKRKSMGKAIIEGGDSKAISAEIVALERAQEAATGAELFVNLEPCCHRGRTHACSTALINRGVRRVVAGIIDPNPLVAGSGVSRSLSLTGAAPA